MMENLTASGDSSTEYSIQFFVILGVFALNLLVTLISAIAYCTKKSKGKKKDELHFKAPGVIPHIVYLLFLGAGAFLILTQVSYDDLTLGGVITVSICYILGLFSVFFSDQYRALRNMTDVEGGKAFAVDMRNAPPVLKFHVECYHFVTTVHHTRNGTHTSTRKVTTYTASHNVPIPFWCDLTPPLYLPADRLIIHVKTRPLVNWLHGSDGIVEAMKNRLYLENRHRDTHCTVNKQITVKGLIEERMILNGKKKKLPFFFRPFGRTICTLLSVGFANLYHIASIASIERFLVIKNASFVQPTVSQDFCSQFHLQYQEIAATAPIVTPQQVNMYQFMPAGSETDFAVSAPCVQNPYPVITEQPFYQVADIGMGFQPTAPNFEIEMSPTTVAMGNESQQYQQYPQYQQPQ